MYFLPPGPIFVELVVVIADPGEAGLDDLTILCVNCSSGYAKLSLKFQNNIVFHTKRACPVTLIYGLMVERIQSRWREKWIKIVPRKKVGTG